MLVIVLIVAYRSSISFLPSRALTRFEHKGFALLGIVDMASCRLCAFCTARVRVNNIDGRTEKKLVSTPKNEYWLEHIECLFTERAASAAPLPLIHNEEI